MKRKLLLVSILSTLFLCIWGGTAQADTIFDTAELSGLLEQQASASYKRPFEFSEKSGESIDEYSGSLSYRVVDMELPGKNGLNVAIRRQYNNQSLKYCYGQVSRYFDYYHAILYTYQYTDANNVLKTVLIAFPTEEDMYQNANDTFYARLSGKTVFHDNHNDFSYYLYNDVKSTAQSGTLMTHVKSIAPIEVVESKTREWYISGENLDTGYRLAQGWELSVPRMKINRQREDDNYYYSGLLSDFDGRTFVFEGIERTDGTHSRFWIGNTSSVKSYILERFYTPLTHNQGFSYYYKLMDPQGRTMYFNQYGQCLAIEDLYGNIITYEYSGTGNNSKITQITDTFGREIDFSYTDNSVAVTVEEGNLHKGVQYIWTDVNDSTTDPNGLLEIDNDYVFTVSVEENASDTEVTEYHAKMSNTIFGNNASFIANGRGIAEKYYNIYRVIYPTGIESCYDYTTKNVQFISDSSSRHHRVEFIAERKEVEEEEDFKCLEYTYTGAHAGSSTYGNYGQTLRTVISNDEGKSETYTYDTYHRINKKVVAATGYHYEEEYAYPYLSSDIPSSGYPCSRITEKYYEGNNVITRQKNYTYDNHLNCLSESYDDYSAAYEYATELPYRMVKSTQTTDTDTYTITDYTLNNQKSVDTMTISQKVGNGNPVLKEQVTYTYDNYGNVSRIRSYPDVTDQTEWVDTEYTYSYAQDKTYSVNQKNKNVQNADGGNVHDITTVSSFDAMGNLVQTTDGKGAQTSYTYDRLGRLLQKTNPDQTTEQYVYNTGGNWTKSISPTGAYTTAYFDGYGNVKSISVTSTEYGTYVAEENTYDSLGRLEKAEQFTGVDGGNANSYYAQYTYEPSGKVASAYLSAGDASYHVDYDYTYNTSPSGTSGSQYLETTAAIGVGANGTTQLTKTTYTRYNGDVREESVSSASDTYTTRYVYNAVGQPTSVFYPNSISVGNTTPDLAYVYDYAGREQTVTQNGALTTTTAYDSMGRSITVTDPAGNITQYEYDAAGRMIREWVTPADTATYGNYGGEIKQYYDDNGNVTQVKELTGTSASPSYRTVTYQYDNMNRLTAEGQAVSETETVYTQYTYTSRGDIAKMITGLTALISDPSTVTASASSPYACTQYTYNSLGYLIRITDPMGRLEIREYSADGELLDTFDRSGYLTEYTYDEKGNVTSVYTENGDATTTYTYNMYGMMSASNAQSTTTYGYDGFGRKNAESTVIPNYQSSSVSYAYDGNGNRVSQTTTVNNVTAQTLSYSYDAYNRLTSVSENGQPAMSYTYNSLGHVISQSGTNYQTDITRNSLGQELSRTNQTVSGVSTVSSLDYTYYLDGNIRTVEDSRTGDATQNYTYAYDGANRLISVSGSRNETYQYDAQGNRTGKSLTENNVTTQTAYTYDKSNRLLTEAESTGGVTTMSGSYSYDGNGNNTYHYVTENGTTTQYAYIYNGQNQMIGYGDGTSPVSYGYDAVGRRIRKSVTGQSSILYTWAEDNIAAEMKGANRTTYTYGLSPIRHTVGTNAEEYLLDAHGSVIQTGNGSGITHSYIYDVFGTELNPSTTDTNPLRYCGEYFDSETGYIYLRARYYDPSIGRFTVEDTHWNIDNMIYGDDQKTIRCAVVNSYKTYYKGNGIIASYELKQPLGQKSYANVLPHFCDQNLICRINDMLDESVSFASPTRVFRNAYDGFEESDITFYEIIRIPDIVTINQSTNLYAYANNNPNMYHDSTGNSATVVVAGGAAFGPAGVVIAAAAVVVVTGVVYLAAEHQKKGTTNPANRNKHENGQARKQKDGGKEKGDARRPKDRSNKKK